MLGGFTVAARLLLATFAGWNTPQRPASISGLVTDTTGRVVPGASITVAAEDGERRTTVTDPPADIESTHSHPATTLSK